MLAYGFIPAIMLLIGGLLALFFKPGPAFRSAIQHFAAGLILSAMSLELLPQFVEDEHFDPHIQGFAAGMILAMLFQSLPRILIKDQANDTVLGKFLVRGLPIVFDGVLVGTLLVSGIGAFVITFAISVEQTFVGMAAAAAFVRLGRSGIGLLALILGMAALFAGGALIGGLVVSTFSELAIDRVIGMATAIMLFVVVEEILHDAHLEDTPDSLFIRIAFFAGFLLTLFIE